jgi:hypothetical protein
LHNNTARSSNDLGSPYSKDVKNSRTVPNDASQQGDIHKHEWCQPPKRSKKRKNIVRRVGDLDPSKTRKGGLRRDTVPPQRIRSGGGENRPPKAEIVYCTCLTQQFKYLKTPTLETNTSLWKQIRHFGDKYVTLDTNTSLWRRIRHSRDKYVTLETNTSL